MAQGNPNQFTEKNKLKKEYTISLIREAVSLMNETSDILDIKSVSLKTKEIDKLGKGISEASFRKKDLEHIQALMIELGIGKYRYIKVNNDSPESKFADQIISLQKESNKLKKVNQEQKSKIKNLKQKVQDVVVENEELRVRIYELELNNKIVHKVQQSNNI